MSPPRPEFVHASTNDPIIVYRLDEHIQIASAATDSVNRKELGGFAGMKSRSDVRAIVRADSTRALWDVRARRIIPQRSRVHTAHSSQWSSLMNAEQQLIDAGLRAWKVNADRVENFFVALSEDQLQQEVAPGRNRLLYLWGHLAAVHDALFPLLGIGPRLYPDLDNMFLANPDRSTPFMLAGSELKPAWGRINSTLWTAFNHWSPSEWLAKHTAVSDEDFRKEPHRNRYSVMLARNTHMAFHYGQMILAKPRGP